MRCYGGIRSVPCLDIGAGAVCSMWNVSVCVRAMVAVGSP